MEAAAADGAKWTEALVRRGCPNARRVTGPFRAAGWTSDAPGGAGREGWRAAKGAAQDAMPGRDGPGRPRGGEETPPGARAPGEAADATRGGRHALAGNPEDLTGSRRERPAEPGRAPPRGLGPRGGPEGRLPRRDGRRGRGHARRLAARGRLPRDRARGRRREEAGRRRADVAAAVAPGAGVGRAGGTDNKAKVTVRMGYGSHDTDNLVALLMLRRSDGQPALPWEDRGEERRKVDERRRRDRERDRKRRRKMARGN